jgi:hypothetical protein
MLCSSAVGFSLDEIEKFDIVEPSVYSLSVRRSAERERLMERKRKEALLRKLFVMLAVAGMVGVTALVVEADQPTRTVKGEVVAVNVADNPPVIVVKTITAKKQESIVGAVVESGTVITRGAKKVTLDNLKVGETASVTYVKNDDGLVARAIHVP